MVKSLRYKLAGRGFDSRWYNWNFSFRTLVDSASNRNEYQVYFLWVRLTTLPPSCVFVMKSGNLNFLETSGPQDLRVICSRYSTDTGWRITIVSNFKSCASITVNKTVIKFPFSHVWRKSIKDFSLLESLHTISGTHPTSYSIVC